MIMDALFTIANFLVFFGVVLYYGKTKLVPMIKQKIVAHRKAQQDLIDQTIAASAQYRSLQEQMSKQDELYARLDRNVERWQKKLDQDYENFQNMGRRQAAFMQNYVAQQQSFLNTFHTTKMVMPVVIKETQTALKHHFEQKEARESYDQNAIDQLARRTS